MACNAHPPRHQRGTARRSPPSGRHSPGWLRKSGTKTQAAHRSEGRNASADEVASQLQAGLLHCRLAGGAARSLTTLLDCRGGKKQGVSSARQQCYRIVQHKLLIWTNTKQPLTLIVKGVHVCIILLSMLQGHTHEGCMCQLQERWVKSTQAHSQHGSVTHVRDGCALQATKTLQRMDQAVTLIGQWDAEQPICCPAVHLSTCLALTGKTGSVCRCWLLKSQHRVRTPHPQT